MVATPEHDKLRLVREKSQACGEFIEFLETRGFYVQAKRRNKDFFNLRRELAAFFQIDEAKLETEKRAMLDELRGESQC